MGRLTLLLLFAVLIVLNFHNLALNDIWQPNEAFYAETSREILEKGNWLDLTYNYEPRLEKPPLIYWLTALSFTYFGINELAARLVPFLSALGTSLLLLLYGWRLKSLEIGLLTATGFLSIVQVFSLARYDAPEMPLTFFLTGALIFYHLSTYGRRFLYLTLSGLFLLLALLAKGIPFVAIYIGSVFFYNLLLFLLKEQTLKGIFKETTISLLLSAIASIPILGWYYYAYTKYGDLFIKVFQNEVLHRALNPNKSWNWSFYFIVILWAFLPFALHFYYSIIGFLKKIKEEKIYQFAFSWFSTVLAVFTVAKGKIPVYILPAFPAMVFFVSRLHNKEHFVLKGLTYFVAFLFFILPFVGIYYFNLPIDGLFLIVFLLSLVLLLQTKPYLTKLIISTIPFYVFLTSSLLPYVEKFRPYKEVITELKNRYEGYKLVCLNSFYKDFPFYWKGKVYKVQSLEEVKRLQGKVLLFAPKPIKGWKVVKSVKLYTGSESRFVKFLKDIKKQKRFKTFYFQVRL
jgi:hypothetical protein